MEALARQLTYRVDPIEDEPLYHFHPGCQILRTTHDLEGAEALGQALSSSGAEAIAVPPTGCHLGRLARRSGTSGIWLVSNCSALEVMHRPSVLSDRDAIVVDLTDFDGRDAPLVDSLTAALGELRDRGVWIELTHTVFGASVGDHSFDALTARLVAALGHDVPLHVAPLRNDARSIDHAAHERWLALANGLHWVYGAWSPKVRTTFCPGCDASLSTRWPLGSAHAALPWTCATCGWRVPGRLD